MSLPGQQEQSRLFLAIARKLALLSTATADELEDEAAHRGVLVSQLALEQGLLTPTQIDIVQTLCAPRDVAPGYEALGVLGQGGMGVVYRARQLALDRTVALKTVKLSQLAADPGSIQRFEQEAALAARLAHPHIVTAYDFGRHHGRLYFVMELIDGEDAARLVDRTGPLGESLAWALVRQAAAGLAHAQELGVVHRDIKPANLLLVQPPTGFPLPRGVPLVKIADFGLARLLQDDQERTRLTTANSTVGSPLYMAPEQLEAKPVDHRTDIYALGATAYHLLAGQPPLAGHALTQVATLKVTGQIPDLRTLRPEISSDSAKLVAALIAVRPSERPGSYDEVLRRIQELDLKSGVADGQLWTPAPSAIAVSIAPTVALPAVTTAPMRTAASSHRWRWAAAGGAALLLMVLLAAVWFNSGRSPGERDLAPTGRAQYLFDGRQIDQWLPISGGWYPQTTDEGGLVLEGDGLVRRAVALGTPTGDSVSLSHYRLTLFLQLRDAQAAEVRFNLANADRSAGHYFVRLTAEGSRLGRRESASATPQSIGPLVPNRTAAERPKVVQIERHTGGWWVLVDEQLIGAVHAASAQPAPEFRVHVEGGRAWISDVTVEELGPPVSAVSPPS